VGKRGTGGKPGGTKTESKGEIKPGKGEKRNQGEVGLPSFGTEKKKNQKKSKGKAARNGDG